MLGSWYNEDVLFTGGTAKGLVVPPILFISRFPVLEKTRRISIQISDFGKLY